MALSYASPTVAAVGQAMPVLSPVVTGTVASYAVSPALPSGLALNAASGAISGTPTLAAAPATYTITATNSSGNTTFALQLAVNPAANAGASLTVPAGNFVTLDGTASATTPGHALVYAWMLRTAPAGSTAGLASPSSPKPIFKADAQGTFVVDLTVRDGALQSAVSTVTVTAIAPVPFAAPAAPASATSVSACQDITSPGNYVLTGDLMSADTSMGCLSIHDTRGVVLDCASHTLSENAATGTFALAASNVQHLTVQNCTLIGRAFPMDTISDALLVANAIKAMPGSAWPATVQLTHPVRVTADHNVFSGALVLPLYGDSVTVSNNSFTMSPDAGPTFNSFVLSHYGTNLRVTNNVMDGRWDGLLWSQYTYNGADDGVVLGDETNAVVEFNTILNVFDSGIEWSGLLKGATIRGNLIMNAGNSGFGGWYWASEVNDHFIGNNVQNGLGMFLIGHAYGIRAAGSDPEGRLPADAGVLVQDNVFDGNVSSRSWNPSASGANMPLFGSYTGGTMLSGMPGERQVVPADLQYSNNGFSNNVFDPSVYAPAFGEPVTPGIVIDQGGNLCGRSGGLQAALACSP
jgi:hypothetical protein